MVVEIVIALGVALSFIIYRLISVYWVPPIERTVSPKIIRKPMESSDRRMDSTTATICDESRINSTGDVNSSTMSVTSRRFSNKFHEEIDSIIVTHRGSPSGLVSLIEELCPKNYEAASALYYKGKEMGVLSSDEMSVDMFRTLSIACVRVGTPHFVFKYLTEMDEYGIPRDLEFYHSLIKLLVFRKFHKISLSLHDVHMSRLLSFDREDSLREDMELLRTIYSCLLFSSIAAKDYWRSAKFFKQLVKTGFPPSDRDIANIIRAIIAREDWSNGFKLLASLPADPPIGQFLDSIPDQKISEAIHAVLKSVVIGELNLLVAELISRSISMQFVDRVFAVVFDSYGGRIDANFAKAVSGVFAHPRADMKCSLADCIIRIIDVRTSVPTSVGELWVGLINAGLPYMSIENMRRLVTHFKAHLIDGSGTGPLVLPDLSTYDGVLTRLASPPSSTLNEIMDIYKMFESQYEAGLIVPDENFFAKAVSSICSVGPGSDGYTLASGILGDMIDTCGIHPSVMIFAAMFDILVKWAEMSIVPKDQRDEYFFDPTMDPVFSACLAFLTLMEENHVSVPIGFLVRIIELAARSGSLSWTNKFFETLAIVAMKKGGSTGGDESPLTLPHSISPICSEELSCLSSKTVTHILRTGAESSLEMFLLVLELSLFFKLKLTDEIFNDKRVMTAHFRNSKESILEITKRYKYRISRNAFLVRDNAHYKK
jgi:hypothetical protein